MPNLPIIINTFNEIELKIVPESNDFHLIYLENIDFIFTVSIISGITITLPLLNGYSYNYSVDWGDGIISSYNNSGATHIYTISGSYDIKIRGLCQSFSVNNGSFKTYITQVKQWGNCDFRKIDFYGCSNLTSLPTGPLSGMDNITTLSNFLRSCTSYTTPLIPNLFMYTPNVTDFSYTFSSTSITGNIPESLFYYTHNVTNFSYTFSSTNLSGSIPPYLFINNTGVTNFSYTLSSYNFTGDIPVQLFSNSPNVLYFTGTFSNCGLLGSGIGGTGFIPEYMFQHNTKVINFDNTFVSCYNLVSGLTNNLFKYCPEVTSFANTFDNCGLRQSLPEDIFWNNPKVTNFQGTFQHGYYLKGSIPEKLFRYNPLVTNFGYTFAFGGVVGGIMTGDIPRDLFAYNTGVTSFEWTFRWNFSNFNIPNGLFRNNKLCRNFNNTFFRCNNTTSQRYPFSASGGTDTEDMAAYKRFSGQTIDFSGMFFCDYYNKGVGTRYAPELWNSTIYNMVGNTHNTNTFYYGAYHQYSNEGSIPVGWK